MNLTKFQVGDRVLWSSQSAGSWKEKVGVIVYKVLSGERPSIGAARIMPELTHATSRTGDSYIVRLDGDRYDHKRPFKVRNLRLKPIYYWPRTSALKKA